MVGHSQQQRALGFSLFQWPGLGRMSAQLNLSFILIGSYINVGIFGLETTMFTNYLRSERAAKDPKHIRLPVLFVYAVDVIGVFGGCALVYVYMFNNWNDASSTSGILEWPFHIIVITSVLSSIAVQCFMVRRYWLFSRIKPITAILLGLSFASFFAAISAIVLFFVFNRLDERRNHIAAVLVTMALAVAADVAISGCLIYKLWHSQIHSRETRSLVKQVTRLSIMAGCAPALNSIAILIPIAIAPTTLVPTGLGLPLGSVYSCTMLYTLNRRESMRASKQSWIHSGVVGPVGDPQRSRV
ncbi:hypothetical protein CC2G_009781 [Coprinopsis cinerea AmutBmut pab1-1]|nr:hypothetical protein CC2G_009781 [Coprinopsis cinerea AmutBmut pab1-1]